VDLSQLRFRSAQGRFVRTWFVRGISPYYRVDLVVQSVRTGFREFFRRRAWTWPGPGQWKDQIRRFGLSAKAFRVRFLGSGSEGESAKSTTRQTFLVNASSLDNMPVSVLEAFTSGNASREHRFPKGCANLVDHERTGLLSPPGEAAPLAETSCDC